MAQTKTSSPSRSKSGTKSNSRSGSTTKSSSRSGSNSKKSSGSGSTSKKSSRGASTSKGSKQSTTARKRQTTSNKSTMATVAEKAKGPAIAGGAALLGLAGGMALKNGRKRGLRDRIPTPSVKKLPKLSMPDVKPDKALKSLSKTAGDVAQRSKRVGDVAAEVEKASKAMSKKA
jgi:hypothetical protein